MGNRYFWRVAAVSVFIAFAATSAFRAGMLCARGADGAAGQWFMDQDRETRWRALLPETDDQSVNRVLTSPGLILYTDREMPLARQVWSNVSDGVHSPLYDLSGGADHIGRGSAHEFPWKDPAGTHQVKDLIELRGVLLPVRDGRRLPIVYYRRPVPYPPGRMPFRKYQYDWVHPVGTVYLELLARPLQDGTAVPFELRLRERTLTGWEVDAFRPFVRWHELHQALVDLGEQSLADRLTRPVLHTVRLHDSFHPEDQEIDVAGPVDSLPAFDDRLVHRLVRRPFRSALGESWWFNEQGGDHVNCFEGGINPRGYAAVMDVNAESCGNCHRSANRSTDFFHLSRDWYGNVRGSDRILSFHIFDPSCISPDGRNLPVRLRRELLQWGLLEPFDPQRHPDSLYRRLGEDR